MRRILIFLLIFLLGFGCIEENNFGGAKLDTVSGSQSVDLDKDGSPDYAVYDYQPVTVDAAGMRITRQVTVSVVSQKTFNKLNANLTDVDLLVADQSLDSFSKSRIQADTACSAAIGLSNVVCSDTVTCSKLCSAASLSCRKIAADYDEALSGNMISYVASNNEIRSLILDARKMVLDMRNTTDDKRAEFMGKLSGMIDKVAEINANPLYTSPDIGLCSHSDFGLSDVVAAMDKIGTHESQNVSYMYRIIISVKPISNATSGTGVQVAGVSITDSIPAAAISQIDQIRSAQSISANQSGNFVTVSWNSPKAVKDGYVLYYAFTSDQGPDDVVNQIKTPDIRVKKINLAFLGPTDAMYNGLYGATRNYFVALGSALGLTVALLLVVYNVLILLFTIVSERAAGMNLTTAFRKAFGRTDVRWKTDIIVAIVFLGAGFYVSSAVAAQPAAPPSLFESVNFLLTSEMGIVAIALMIIGVIMAYFAVENFAKLTILERAYGMVIRQEKDMFLAKAASLKDRLKELEEMIEAYSKDDFDVSKEYDVLTSMKAEKVDALAKEMTARTKAIIEEDLAKVENAVGSLKERKKTADENWPKWKETIAKMLDEQDEVYTTSLVTIPNSLRSWALGKYVREEGSESVAFERDSLKKKKVTPNQLVQEMISRGLIKGAIVMKQEKVVVSEFSELNATVMSALSLKLNSYTQSLAKNLGQSAAQSYVSVGDKMVVVIMKSRTVDSVLFVGKDKFNDAVAQWKGKMKILEGS